MFRVFQHTLKYGQEARNKTIYWKVFEIWCELMDDWIEFSNWWKSQSNWVIKSKAWIKVIKKQKPAIKMDSTKMTGLLMPVWDRKAEFCPRYLFQIEELAEYCDCGDALDAKEMKTVQPKLSARHWDLPIPMTLQKQNSTRPTRNFVQLSHLGRKLIMDCWLSPKLSQMIVLKALLILFLKCQKWRTSQMMLLPRLNWRKCLIEFNFEMPRTTTKTVSVNARFDVSVSRTELVKIMANKVTSAM